jgi:hypothetical protein
MYGFGFGSGGGTRTTSDSALTRLPRERARPPEAVGSLRHLHFALEDLEEKYRSKQCS